MFGVREAGGLAPEEEEVRALTEEHAWEMAGLLADLTHLAWCRKHRLDPSTGKPPKPHREKRLSERLQCEINEFSESYEGCLAAYADAFGVEASELLDAAVRRFVAASSPNEIPTIQRQLF